MSASAKNERYPQLSPVTDNTIKGFSKKVNKVVKLKRTYLAQSEYSLELAENTVMKTAQHNMRFRVYDLASYNFSELAQLYIQQGRYSEAKWFFLQSNMLSRQQNNDKLTISNLLNLAEVKSKIGDFVLAQDDLFEARDMASAHGWLTDVISVEKKLKAIQLSRVLNTKTELRYASNAKAETASVN
ncbi:hypothetical protein [Mucilaginibacter ginkgonis]|uniref:Tetratricopeptide repeat protein n=1 Tax=Mucilaginibacter ginkgonis TaxID=2682091 RepID=A0A6I4HY05_9SPHI|nr:hypothetical protein [Mucilaginibacter ginkgonis]QQL49341.1 hypothetical protein GO620_014355 [Mucilaginibacter ginkgonis]